MASRSLVNYIMAIKANGEDEASIRTRLARMRCWPTQEIDAAFHEIASAPNINPSPQPADFTTANCPVKMSPLSKLLAVFLHPSKFFDMVASESWYWTPFLFWLTTDIVLVFVNLAIGLCTVHGSIFEMLGYTLGSILGLLAYLGLLLFTTIGLFIYAAFVYVLVLIIGGNRGFGRSFKVIFYASIIFSLYSFIDTVLFGVLNGQTTINNALPHVAAVPADSASFPLSTMLYSLITFVVILALSVIHFLVAATSGISKYHGISKNKALFALVTPLLLLTATLITVLITVFTVIFFVLKEAFLAIWR